MQSPLRLFLPIAATAALLVPAIHARDEPWAGGEQDVAFAATLWSALRDARLVGADAIETQPYEGVEPHGALLQTLAMSLNVDGRNDRVVVKRNLVGVTSAEVWAEPGAGLDSVTVMFRREAGYDPENGNWFWAKYQPDGTLARNPADMALAGRVGKGADQGCIACHRGAGGGDYLFVNDG